MASFDTRMEGKFTAGGPATLTHTYTPREHPRHRTAVQAAVAHVSDRTHTEDSPAQLTSVELSRARPPQLLYQS